MTDFPEVPNSLPADKKQEWEKAVFDAQLKRIESSAAAESSINAEFYKSVFAVAQGSIDRARAGAETVQKASAAIAALYTALFGVVSSTKDNPLPSRGVIPMLFLGLAVVASTAYIAYQTRSKPVGVLTPQGSAFERNLERARSLIAWTQRAADHRAYLLKLSVVALAAGLVFIPAAFVSFKSTPKPGGAAETTTTAAMTTTPIEPDWPTPSTNAGDRVALQKVVYEAQVAEAAEQRKAKPVAPLDTGANDSWWLAAAVVFGLTLLAPLLIDRLFGAAQSDS